MRAAYRSEYAEAAGMMLLYHVIRRISRLYFLFLPISAKQKAKTAVQSPCGMPMRG